MLGEGGRERAVALTGAVFAIGAPPAPRGWGKREGEGGSFDL